MKSLKEISLPITEEEYRNDGCMHYSTLATFDRGGFNVLPTLFDRKESPSLTFGSIVDCLVTGTPEEFEKQYLVADSSVDGSDVLINVTKSLFNLYKEEYKRLEDIPQNILSASLDAVNYGGKNWHTITKIKKLLEVGSEYYRLMFVAKDKIIISSDSYNKALACVRALHESPATKFLFQADNPFEPEVERLYQLKFKATIEGIDFSCMADEILVLHKTKKILPIDLKTSSHKEYEFFKSFVEWDYQIQGRNYYRILKANVEKDDYFKDFEILNWHFVVVNKETLNPLVWEFKDTKTQGTLTYGKEGQIKMKDPLDIAKELKYYLDHKPSVPMGILLDKPNDLTQYLNTL